MSIRYPNWFEATINTLTGRGAANDVGHGPPVLMDVGGGRMEYRVPKFDREGNPLGYRYLDPQKDKDFNPVQLQTSAARATEANIIEKAEARNERREQKQDARYQVELSHRNKVFDAENQRSAEAHTLAVTGVLAGIRNQDNNNKLLLKQLGQNFELGKGQQDLAAAGLILQAGNNRDMLRLKEQEQAQLVALRNQEMDLQRDKFERSKIETASAAKLSLIGDAMKALMLA